jgi:hypothetical protein
MLPDKKIDLDCSQSIQLANLVLSTFSVFYPFTFVFYLKPPALSFKITIIPSKIHY